MKTFVQKEDGTYVLEGDTSVAEMDNHKERQSKSYEQQYQEWLAQVSDYHRNMQNCAMDSLYRQMSGGLGGLFQNQYKPAYEKSAYVYNEPNKPKTNKYKFWIIYFIISLLINLPINFILDLNTMQVFFVDIPIDFALFWIIDYFY